MTTEDKQLFFDSIYYDGVQFIPFPPLQRNIQQRLEEIRNFEVRQGDVLLSTFPKSGTHWMFELLNMLVNRKAEYIKDMVGNFLEVVDSLSELDEIPNPRVLATHLPYRFLPKSHREHGAKIVRVIRNPKDVTVSHYYHLKSSIQSDVTWSTYVDDVIRGKVKTQGGWFAFEREFEEATRNNKNLRIHIVYYEDLKENLVNELRKLAGFLEIECDTELLEGIANKCRFDNMKKADEVGVKPRTKLTELMEKMQQFQFHPSIYRKGTVGDWKNIFTVAQDEEFNDVLQNEMKGSELKCLSLC